MMVSNHSLEFLFPNVSVHSPHMSNVSIHCQVQLERNMTTLSGQRYPSLKNYYKYTLATWSLNHGYNLLNGVCLCCGIGC